MAESKSWTAASSFGLRMTLISGLVLLCGAVTPAIARGERWVDIWGSMPQLVEPHNLPPAPYNSGDAVFRNATIRQTVYLTQDASTIRLQFSNAFGATDLPILAATVALPLTSSSSSTGSGTSSIRPETLKEVTFSGGSPSFTIPNGALAISDPISLPVKSQSVLTVTIYFGPSGQAGQSVTGHPGSRTTSYLAPGNQVSAPDLSTIPDSGKTDHWYILSTIQGYLPPSASSLSIIGDSITDGRGSTTNNNNRWPDRLLSRLQSSKSPLHRQIPVINQAAGGNRLLADGLGPNALGRVERDVLAHPNTKYAIVYIGVNDIGTAAPNQPVLDATGDRMISAYKQIITRLHGNNIAVFGATITPMSGPGQTYSDPLRENLRQRINTWIRTGEDSYPLTSSTTPPSKKAAPKGKGNSSPAKGGIKFDAVIDFDALVRDPTNTTQLSTQYDVGDYLHLNPAGYEAMGAAVDLGLFERFREGVEDSFL